LVEATFKPAEQVGGLFVPLKVGGLFVPLKVGDAFSYGRAFMRHDANSVGLRLLLFCLSPVGHHSLFLGIRRRLMTMTTPAAEAVDSMGWGRSYLI
tara:strand:- start:416 stop:703 length:288 start_codon:yes stop_codon:yes gene_type:complete